MAKGRLLRAWQAMSTAGVAASADSCSREAMRREWTPEDLIASWTLVEDDWRLVGNKAGATRLGFALLLKFFELEGRFPRQAVRSDALP
jgi:Domain of unknown function (DUF4158)